MQRTNIVKLKPTKTQKKILKEMMYLSSCVYNMANYVVRNQFFNKEKISTYFDLKTKIQNKEDYQMLGRSYSSPRIQIYSETNSARFKLMKSKRQKNVGLPRYYKNRKTNTTIPSYLVMDNSQYSIKKNYVIIPMSRLMRKKNKIGQTFKIKYNGILKHKGKQLRGQIHYKEGHFYLYQSVELKEPKEIKSKIKVGIDLGIKRIFSIYINNNKTKLIGSNRFFKQWKYYTNLISKEQQYLSTINRKSSNNLIKLFNKRQKYQNNLFNNLVAKLFRVLKQNNVDEIFVGDVKNIRKNNKNSKLVNQMINNYWSFDKLNKKLENKSEEFGITLTKTTEEYTSITCPKCLHKDKNNVDDRNFKCTNCNHVDDRDIVGAKNIYSKGMYGSIKSIHWNETIPLGVST